MNTVDFKDKYLNAIINDIATHNIILTKKSFRHYYDVSLAHAEICTTLLEQRADTDERFLISTFGIRFCIQNKNIQDEEKNLKQLVTIAIHIVSFIQNTPSFYGLHTLVDEIKYDIDGAEERDKFFCTIIIQSKEIIY